MYYYQSVVSKASVVYKQINFLRKQAVFSACPFIINIIIIVVVVIIIIIIIASINLFHFYRAAWNADAV